jgi:hypothetical protein
LSYPNDKWVQNQNFKEDQIAKPQQQIFDDEPEASLKSSRSNLNSQSTQKQLRSPNINEVKGSNPSLEKTDSQET